MRKIMGRLDGGKLMGGGDASEAKERHIAYQLAKDVVVFVYQLISQFLVFFHKLEN